MKYIILCLSVLIIIAAISFPVNAQNDIRFGYIVKLNNDTIKGFVKYKNEGDLFKKCVFKSKDDVGYKNYSPGELIGFGFQNGRVFISSINYLKQTDSIRYFSEIYLKGRLTEYIVNNKIFLTDDTLRKYDLVNTTKIVVYNGRKYLKELNEYKGILLYLLRDCISLQSKIENLRLYPFRIKDLIKSYYRCTKEDYQDIYIRSKFLEKGLGFSIEPGISKISLDEVFFQGSTQHISMDAYYGIGYKVFYFTELPRINNRISLQLEAGYKNHMYTFSEYMENSREYFDIKTSFKKISGGILGKYSIPFGFSQLYFLGGMQLNYIFDNDFKSLLEIVENQNQVFTYYNKDLDFTNIEPAIQAGIGLRRTINFYNIVFLEGRYEYGFGITQKAYSNSYSNNAFIGVGYSRILNNYK